MTVMHGPPPRGIRTFRLAYLVCAALLLAGPLVAMRFTADVNWGVGDFVVAGGLLALLGFAIDLALRVPASPRSRVVMIAGVSAAFLLVWAELAIGLFD